MRVTFAPGFFTADERLTSTGAVRIDAPWNADRLGTGFAPVFLGAEDAIRAATGDPTFELALGAGTAAISTLETRLPIGVAVGVGDRFTLGAVVPLVQGRFEAVAEVDGGVGGNVGLNPGSIDTGSVQTILGEFETAAGAASTAADALCASQGSTSAECTAALATAASASALSTDLAGLYQGFALFPIDGSVPADVLVARVEEARTALATLGVTGIPAAIPLAAPLTDGDLEILARDAVFGGAFVDYGTWRGGWGLGDIDLQASFLLVRRTDPDGGSEAEVSAGLIGRLGLAEGEDPDRLFQMGRGTGVHEVGGFAHGSVSSNRWAMEVDVRLARGLEIEVPVRVSTPGGVLTGPDARTDATLVPGGRMRFEASPRYRLSAALAIAGRYSWERIDAVGYERVHEEGPDPSALDHATATTIHRIGGGLIYSPTRAESAQHQPFELRAQIDGVQSGTGAGARAVVRGSVEIRIHRRAFGGD